MVLDRVAGGASSRFEPTRSWQRSLAKTLTWRLFATADTFVISALVTGNLRWAGSIVGVEVVTKMMWYFLHERAWAYTRAGVATAARPCLGRLRQREHPPCVQRTEHLSGRRGQSVRLGSDQYSSPVFREMVAMIPVERSANSQNVKKDTNYQRRGLCLADAPSSINQRAEEKLL